MRGFAWRPPSLSAVIGALQRRRSGAVIAALGRTPVRRPWWPHLIVAALPSSRPPSLRGVAPPLGPISTWACLLGCPAADVAALNFTPAWCCRPIAEAALRRPPSSRKVTLPPPRPPGGHVCLAALLWPHRRVPGCLSVNRAKSAPSQPRLASRPFFILRGAAFMLPLVPSSCSFYDCGGRPRTLARGRQGDSRGGSAVVRCVAASRTSFLPLDVSPHAQVTRHHWRAA